MVNPKSGGERDCPYNREGQVADELSIFPGHEDRWRNKSPTKLTLVHGPLVPSPGGEPELRVSLRWGT